MNKEYELMVILKPLLPEDIRSGIEKRLETLIKKMKGSIKDTDVWGKRHLAYKIDNHEEGYYIVYDLELDPSKVKEMNEEIKLFNDIIRFILIRKDNQ